MSLSDRLSQLRVNGAQPIERRGTPRRLRHADPFAQLKRSVH